jgi:glycosyltransferase involved in cell wall biosynthesis
MRALVLAPNRWDGILEVGIFKLAKFLKVMGFDVRFSNLEGFRHIFSEKFAWFLPKSFGWSNKVFWEITYKLNSHKFGKDWDLIITDASHMIFFANRLNAKFKVYRLNDLLEGFNLPTFFVEEEKRFIERADLVLSAHSTLSYKVKDKNKFFLLPNPINLNLFPTENIIEPEDLMEIPRPRVIYIGAMFDWFDWEAVIFTAENLRNFSFILIGPYKNPPKNLPSNIYLLGKRAHREIHRYLYYCDVGFIPFKLSPLITHMDHPNKVLEYFAMGLPVVSVYWEAFYRNFPEVFFYNSIEEITQKIELAIRKGRSWELRERAKEYDEERIFQRFKDIISQLFQR